jgi:hypothetical protein
MNGITALLLVYAFMARAGETLPFPFCGLFEDTPYSPNVNLILQFLGAFAKLRKVTVSFVMSARLSGHMEQLSFH